MTSLQFCWEPYVKYIVPLVLVLVFNTANSREVFTISRSDEDFSSSSVQFNDISATKENLERTKVKPTNRRILKNVRLISDIGKVLFF